MSCDIGGGKLCNPDAAANTFTYFLNYAATLLLMLHDTSWSFCCSCKDKDAVSIVGQNRYPNDSNISRANYYFLRPQVRELFEILKCTNLIKGANYY